MANALFKTKTVKIDTLGEYLAQVRNQLNLDIKTVSLLTQIKQIYLENLEAGNYPALPADVYIRGFLKSLATFYRLKEKLLIDQYEKERGFEVAHARLMKGSKEKFAFTPKTIVVIVTVLVAIGAIAYVGNQIKSVLVKPYLEITEPTSDLTVQGSSIVVAGKSEIGSEVSINNQPVLTDANGEFTENLLLGSGLNSVEIVAKNKFGKVSTITRQITAQTESVKPVEAAPINLVVSIGPGSAWVSIEADGVVEQKGTMLAGSTKIITAKDDIIITSANAGSTQVIYNGKDLGKLGREGEVIRNVEFSSK